MTDHALFSNADELRTWEYLRQKFARLSVGDRKRFSATSTELLNLQHESPESRIVLFTLNNTPTYWEPAASRKLLLPKAKINVGTDGAQTWFAGVIPWNGLAVRIPAGRVMAKVDATDAIAVNGGPTEEQQVDVQVIASAQGSALAGIVPAIGAFNTPSNHLDGFYRVNGTTSVDAPPFSRVAEVLCIDGNANLNIGSPLGALQAQIQLTATPVAGQFTTVRIPVPLPGWLTFTGNANIAIVWSGGL